MDHPNIIKYVESFEDSRYMYIVTEYVARSRDLSDIMIDAANNKDRDHSTTLLPVSDVQKLMRMVLKGITHMHANGIIHRDIKPANCLLDDKL